MDHCLKLFMETQFNWQILIFKMLQVTGESETDISTCSHITVIDSFKGYGKR